MSLREPFNSTIFGAYVVAGAIFCGFAMVLVTYSGSLWFTGLHAYSGL